MRSKTLPAVAHPELALLRNVDRVEVPLELVTKQQTFSAAIALCIQVSGLEEKEVYLTLGIDAGHWTRIMKGEAHFPVNKLNDLMTICGNEAPLTWLAHSRGYGLVLLKSEAERRAEEAERLLHETQEKLRFLTQVMQGRVSA